MSRRNVEVKFRLSVQKYLELCEKIERLFSSHKIDQTDTFFQTSCPDIRLKLREETYSRVEDNHLFYLISYTRSDDAKARLSSYDICPCTEELGLVMKKSLPVLDCVKKFRTVSLHEQTRIHLDFIDGLGHFGEIEVVLTNLQTVEDGQTILEKYLQILDISKNAFLSSAYVDLLLKK